MKIYIAANLQDASIVRLWHDEGDDFELNRLISPIDFESNDERKVMSYDVKFRAGIIVVTYEPPHFIKF